MHAVKPGARAVVYVLQCCDGSLYAGASMRLADRLRAHRRGVAARYTRGRLPVRLIAWWYPAGYSAAKSQEARFKTLSRCEKLAFLEGREAFGLPMHKPPS